MRWNLHSNAGDVLGLGPRSAGLLATVGVRTVGELLAANASEVAARLRESPISSDVLSAWQCEARLIVELPELSTSAARLLAATKLGDVQQIANCTPTELLAAIETAQHETSLNWLAQTTLPSISQVSEWILFARGEEKSRAA